MITTKWDSYLQERMELKSRWEVTLSDGRKVYQDDERHGRPSWLGLKEYIEQSNFANAYSEGPPLRIVGMFMGFRDNVIVLPENADGYFFRYSIFAGWGNGYVKHAFVIGVLQDGVLTVQKYDLPEMIFCGSEERPIEEAGESLILCQKKEKIPSSQI